MTTNKNIALYSFITMLMKNGNFAHLADNKEIGNGMFNAHPDFHTTDVEWYSG